MHKEVIAAWIIAAAQYRSLSTIHFQMLMQGRAAYSEMRIKCADLPLAAGGLTILRIRLVSSNSTVDPSPMSLFSEIDFGDRL